MRGGARRLRRVDSFRLARIFIKEADIWASRQILTQLQDNQVLKSRLSKFTVSADGEFVQVPLAQITWYHHISMFPKVKDNVLRAFHITESALQGLSRDIMLMQIDDGYHKKVKSLPNNFADTLPPLKKVT